MSLDRYLRAFRHYWYVAVGFVLAGALGTSVYLVFNLDHKAVITVAVLEPGITNNLDGEQAQVNFGSVAESRKVAERVVQRLDLDIDAAALQSKITVELARTLIPSVASPLYTVEVEDADEQRALSIAEAVVSEAQTAFTELNTLDIATVDSLVAPQEAVLREQLEDAHRQLRDFEEQTGAWLLPLQIEDQMQLIRLIRQSSGFQPVTEAVEQELQRTLSQAQADLDTLYVLLPEYERISLDAALAIDRLLILSDAQSLRDFALRPSTATSEIEESLNAWHEARTALLEFLDQDIQSGNVSTSSPDAADAYDRWRSARNVLLRTLATEVESNDADSVAAGEQPAYPDTAGILDLPERLESQQLFVENVQYLLLSNRLNSLGYESALSAEEGKLERMLGLLPEYQVLAARVGQMEQALQMGIARKAELIFEGSRPTAAQIKVVDPAHIESSLLDIVFPVALTATFTAAAAAGAVYLLAYFINTPLSAEDVRQWLGVPILANLPRGKR